MSKLVLGICGSGQLSMMLCQAANKIGIRTVVLSEEDKVPAKNYCDELFVCNFRDQDKLIDFCKKVDFVTLEFENFDFETLKFIEKFKPIYPKPEINKVVQNRKLEKKFFHDLNIPTTKYAIINSFEDLKKNQDLLPGILKSTTGGYDGHFSFKINSLDEINDHKIDFSKEFILEKKVTLIKEFSIIAVRYHSNKINIFEPFENFHQDQILKTTTIPANISNELKITANQYTKKILEKHGYVGAMAVEFFIDTENKLLANETASRVHNSGHITINASNSSQFDQHIRAVCNLDFLSLKKMIKGKMINILGSDIIKFRSKKFSKNEFFFDYQKKDIKPKRKMGHLNIIEKK